MADRWTIRYDGFDPDDEGLREALCALGNGRFVTRAAAEEAEADGVHYPGTYLAGGYNELESEVAGRTVVNEDLVNMPNWLPLNFRPEGGDWLDLSRVEVLEYLQELRMRQGMLVRRFRVRDGAGRTTAVESRRIVHMRLPHLAAIDYRITPEDWGGRLEVRTMLDGTVVNAGVERYSQLSNRHLETLERGAVAPEGVYLLVQTNHSRIQVGFAARTRLFAGGEPAGHEHRLIDGERDRIGESFMVEVGQGDTLRVEKVVANHHVRDRGITEPGLDARLALARAPDFDTLLESHRTAWSVLWRRFDIEMEGRSENGVSLERAQQILRLHIFHLLQAVSFHTIGLDVGAPARGLHGEAYRGHIFWDELFIFPFYMDRAPSIVRSLLLYRYHRLEAARELAREAGYRGAMFPWQSSSDGREATQELHLNPMSGRWDPDHSRLQRHVNVGIAFNVWQYYRSTGDRVFLLDYGAELLLEIARFWSSIATMSDTSGRYEIRGVMGPDEYHEKYPDAEQGGLDNNAYTNVMAVWCLLRALDAVEAIGQARAEELMQLLDLPREELDRWRDITRLMYVPFHDGVISQFDGYDDLEELDWDAYRQKYGDVARLDRILKAENDTPDRYKVSKQADVEMLFYLLRPDEVSDLFRRLGYELDDAAVRRTIDYYESRTSHGSTLSRVVYASVVHRLDCEAGCRLFLEALRSDVDDIQGGTTAEGIHLGAMAGTVGIVLRHYAGVDIGPRGVSFDPQLPRIFHRFRFSVHWRGRWLEVELGRDRLRLSVDAGDQVPVPVRTNGEWRELMPGHSIELELDAGCLPADPPLNAPDLEAG